MAIGGHWWPLEAIDDHVKPFEDINDHWKTLMTMCLAIDCVLRPLMIIIECSWRPGTRSVNWKQWMISRLMTIGDHLPPFETIRRHWWSFEAIHKYFKECKAINNHLMPLMIIIRGHWRGETLKTIWDHWWQLETIDQLRLLIIKGDH